MFNRLSRRALLCRAASAVIGLPLLQAMIPGGRLFADDPPSAAKIPKRLCVVYVPHGLWMNAFLPTQVGYGFPLSPTLEPLARLSGRFSIVSNLMMDTGAGIMHHAGEMFLTNNRIPEVDRFSPNFLSMDRLVVQHHAGQTLLPSLELSLSAFNGSGHRNTVAFDHRGTPLPGQNNPRAVFETLFGSTDNPEAQRAALLEQRSILDGVLPQVHSLRRSLGQNDDRVLEEYLESIRNTERYIQRLEKRIDKPTRPQEQGLVLTDSKVSTRMRNMFDLMFLALRADLTRVVSFVVFKERADGEQTYPELGFVGEHHGWTHSIPEPTKKKEIIHILSTVDRFNIEQLSYFLQRLHDTPEGDGTMLDNTLVLYGSGLSVNDSGAIHDPYNLPILVAGGEAMGVRQGQHVRYDKGEKLVNLNLTLLQLLGVDCQAWKDSTHALTALRK